VRCAESRRLVMENRRRMPATMCAHSARRFSMLNRLTLLGVVLLPIPTSVRAQPPTWHVRKGTLPAIRATRADLEGLLADVIQRADKLPPGMVLPYGAPEVLIMASTATGKDVGSLISPARRAPATAGIDTLRRYIGRKSRLTMLKLTYADRRYGNGPLVRTPITAEFTFFAAGADNQYSVLGSERERVNEIADAIEAFGESHATWRTPRVGEAIKAAIQTVAVLLLPIGIAVRDRRASWVFYPAGLVLMAASYFIPFATLFSNFAMIVPSPMR
jgi:hypothetical protein